MGSREAQTSLFFMDWRNNCMLGFTYNGKHTDDLKVKYIPDAIERGDFYADFETIHIERSWFAGGEYFKSRVKTRVFELSCYYEQITREDREAILRWLDRRTSGELIFDERPYASYRVHPTKKIEFKDYLQRINDIDLFSGTFTITFSAFYPFAKLLYETSDALESNYICETNLLPRSMMPPVVAVNDTEFLVYNPGTEIGHSVIQFAGSTGSNDFVIRNVTTGDVCVIRRGLNTADDVHYELNSKLGRAEDVERGYRTLNFVFHDEGYITFAPCEVVIRDAVVETTSGKREVVSDGLFDESLIGKYIYLDSGWRYIGDVLDENTLTTNINAASTGTFITSIVTMNRLTVTKASDAFVETLKVECKAEVR